MFSEKQALGFVDFSPWNLAFCFINVYFYLVSILLHTLA